MNVDDAAVARQNAEAEREVRKLLGIAPRVDEVLRVLDELVGREQVADAPLGTADVADLSEIRVPHGGDKILNAALKLLVV